MPIGFTEQNVEDMVLQAIQSGGWEYVPAEQLPRAESDVLVEKYLREALIRLNPCISEDTSRADTVIYKLRALISTVRPHDLVTQNERFKKLIFEENSFPFDKDGRAISIKFFDYDNPDNNSFVVTNQWVYPQARGGKRLDIVLLINGFPVSIGEMKTPFRPAISWMDGASDILDYEKSIPEMFVTNIFNFATEGKCFRYGAINAPVTLWGPWYSNIPHEEGDMPKVQKAIASITKKEVILDLFRYFTLFSTDKHNRKIKIVCRYQQYEGANLIVDRVKAGYPKKGLIWHFQGSGKSLLMVFAAQKLRMVKELNAPTVIIVNDRIDLSGQIFGTFSMADVPNLVPADTNAELIRLLKADSRKVIITKIFEFAQVTEPINYRDNIILMVDEAHRTQEGDLGNKMRTALPNAFFFGLTGTPINKLDRNTFATFGATEDRTGYMSRYSFADSVNDRATLPLHFEPVPVKLHVDQTAIDEAFRALSDEAGLTEEERSKVAQRVRMSAIMKDPERIKLVEACINFFPGVDRTRTDWEGLVAAQDCLPNDKIKDAFGAQYRVLNRVWNALSPDSCLNPYKADYKWLSKVYDSIRPTDERGKLIWAALGPKTIQLVHDNITVNEVVKDEDVLEMDAQIIEQFIKGKGGAEKQKRKIEIDLAAVIRKHPEDPRYIALGERMEKLREEHEAGLLTSMEFLKALLELAKDAVQLEKEDAGNEPEDPTARGKAALSKLFESVKNDSTPIIVERIVNDIDGIVRIVRFPGWQNTSTGRKEVSKNLRDVIMRKYRIKDQDVFSRAYSYVEQYY